jgi:hypothetical protein
VYERVRPNIKPAAQPVWGKKDAPEGIARDEQIREKQRRGKRKSKKKEKKKRGKR